jgi:peptidoglycan/LPS O-acetylase OafA/YrhL
MAEVSATPAKKGTSTVATLELLRGLASLDVFLWHLLNYPCGIPHIPGLYRVAGWSRESVIVFFVLSGYVIALSQQRLHRTALPFLKARVKRIVPLYLIALGLALVASWVVNDWPTAWQMIGHLLFLQSYEGSLVMPLPTDGPLWSLGTEFEFYLTLVVILALRRPGLIVVWWTLALGAVVVRYFGNVSSGAEGLLLEFLALSPCWLLGYSAAGIGARWSLTLVEALALFFMVPMVACSNFGTVIVAVGGIDNLKCFLYALLIAPLIHTLAVRQLFPEARPWRLGIWLVAGVYLLVVFWYGRHAVVDYRSLPKLTLIGLPVFVFLLGQLLWPRGMIWPVKTAGFRRGAIFLGGASYALYVIHTPISFIVIHTVPGTTFRFLVLLTAVGAAVVFLEYVAQPWLARGLDRLWGSKASR